MSRVSHDELARRLDMGTKRFDDIEQTLMAIMEQTSAIPKMQEDIAETREMVEAWAAVKTAGRFLKWLAGIIAALAAIIAAAKIGLSDFSR